MKRVSIKVDILLMVALLSLCLLYFVGNRTGTVESQTSSQPATSTPATSTPAAPASDTTTTDVKNRPMSRWMTSNAVWLNTLINDSKKMLAYLKDMNLAYAEIACPQLTADIATMRGRSPMWNMMGLYTRYLEDAPSGHRCPPIPDAQTAADLNVGMAQLESAIRNIFNGINTHNGALIMLGESETQAACDTFDRVLEDLSNLPDVPSELVPPASTPWESIQSFLDAVQAGDMDVVSMITGGSGGQPGISTWCSKGLAAFVGHSSFVSWGSVLTHNDDLNANVSFDGFMTFNDPAQFPSVTCPLHFQIDGDFKFKAVNGKWIIVALPNFQEMMCDGPNSWGGCKYNYPYPGDAI